MDLALMKIELDGQPLPATMSRLTALTSLALHHIGWEYAPEGLPHLPQVRHLLKSRAPHCTKKFTRLHGNIASVCVQTSLLPHVGGAHVWHMINGTALLLTTSHHSVQ